MTLYTPRNAFASPWPTSITIAAYNAAPWLKAQADIICDGAKDQEKINDAINRLPPAGGKIQLTDGIFVLSAPIEISRGGITFEGILSSSYDQVTKITLSAGVNDSIIKCATRSSGITNSIRIAYLFLYGNKDNQTAGHGIYWNGPAWSEIEDIEFENIYQHGIFVEGNAGAGYNQVNTINKVRVRGTIGGSAICLDTITDSWITYCDLNSTGSCLYVNGANNHLIGNNVYLSGAKGIHLDTSGDNCFVIANRSDDNAGDGIDIAGDTTELIANKSFNNGGNGITYHIRYGLVIGNHCYNNTGSGIQASDDVFDSQFIGNHCWNNGTYGIHAFDVSRLTLLSNTCRANGVDGIFLDRFVGTVEHDTINHNTCSSNGGYGIVIDPLTDYITLTENICPSNTSGAIAYNSTGIHNTVDKNDGWFDSAGTLARDHTWDGKTEIYTAGTALSFGQLVYEGSDGKMELTDADAAATMPAQYMALGTIAEDASGLFLCPGSKFRDDSYNWSTKGAALYASTSPGEITATAPNGSGDQVQKVGHVIDADNIWFEPNPTIVQAP